MLDPSTPIAGGNLVARMRFVKSACDAAPASAKKSVSLRRYLSAERAQTCGDETECIRRLDAAIKALK
ncbi:MAG: hypothetical protein ACK4NV_11215 [Pannonibacter sp.]